jgi:PAS domain S-box-containing protein
VTESKRIVWLIVIMMAAVTVSTAVAIAVLYRTAFEQERAHLLQNVDDQAHLMEAVARFDQEHGQGNLLGSQAATLSQIKNAFDHYPSVGQIAEIAVAQRQGDEIVFLVTHGRVVDQRIQVIPFDSDLAEPMRRALSGHAGSMIGLDYRGVEVLAAYEPVPILDAGVVAKMDLADIRAPFVRGGAMVIGLALVLVTVGTLLFVRLTNPIVKHLTETEQRYQRIFCAAPVPIWEQDFSAVAADLRALRQSGVADLGTYLEEHPGTVAQLAGQIRIKEVNSAALRLFGTNSVQDFVAWIEGSLLPATPDLVADELAALWEGREALLSRTFSVPSPNGTELTVVLSLVIPNAEHGYDSIATSALDVTADVTLHRREQELDLIMSSTGEGIFGTDNQGRCTFVNRAAAQMLGYPDEAALLGREMHALIHHTCRDGTPLPPSDCPIYRAFRGNTVGCFDNELFWRANGSSFAAECRSYPMVRDGTTVGNVITFTDITERKAREAQLLHAQKMEVVGQLTGGIAHDFNNLITIILTNLHFLQERGGKAADGETIELIADAVSAAQDAASLTRRLLAFARRQPLEPQWMDLGIFIEHTCRFLRRVTGAGIDLVLRRGAEPLPVRVDRQQLENTILNLTINARDAMPNGGTLTIEARREHLIAGEAQSRPGLATGPYVVVSIADTGIGMSPEIVQRAVEPFYSTKPMGKGSGLGLSSSLGFAQQSGGDLAISSAPGEGTTVRLYLPELSPQREERLGPEQRAEPAGSAAEAATILVVEDEARTRRLAIQTLTELGYRVVETDNADAAALMIRNNLDVDLLFTDVVMPGELDGLKLGRWARELRPGLKVLVTSGLPHDKADAVENGDDALRFIMKPYTREALREVVGSLLDVRVS